MAGITGKNLYLAFNGTVLDTDYRSFAPNEEIGIVDQSAGSDAARTYLTTLEDGTATATIVIQSDDTTTWGAVDKGAEGTLEWGEEGTTAGNMRHYVNAIVTGRNRSMSFDDLVVGDLSFQFSGEVVDTTY